MTATLIGIDENSCQAIALSKLRWYLVSLDTAWIPQELPERSARARLASGALALTGKRRESQSRAADDDEDPPASERRPVAPEERPEPNEFASLEELADAVRKRCMDQVSPAGRGSLTILDLLKRQALRGNLQAGPAPTSILDVFALLRGQSASAPGDVEGCFEVLFERYNREIFAFASEPLQLPPLEADRLTTEVFWQVRYALKAGENPDLLWCWRQALEIFESWVSQSPPSGN